MAVVVTPMFPAVTVVVPGVTVAMLETMLLHPADRPFARRQHVHQRAAVGLQRVLHARTPAMKDNRGRHDRMRALVNIIGNTIAVRICRAERNAVYADTSHSERLTSLKCVSTMRDFRPMIKNRSGGSVVFLKVSFTSSFTGSSKS